MSSRAVKKSGPPAKGSQRKKKRKKEGKEIYSTNHQVIRVINSFGSSCAVCYVEINSFSIEPRTITLRATLIAPWLGVYGGKQ